MFKMKLEFTESNKENMEEINRILGAGRYESVSIEDNQGCLITVRNGEGAVIDRFYGFENVTFALESAGDGKGHHYQLDTAVFDICEFNGTEFNRLWSSMHPDRVMRIMMEIQYESANAKAFVVLHMDRR